MNLTNPIEVQDQTKTEKADFDNMKVEYALQLRKGHKIWEYNRETGECIEAIYEAQKEFAYDVAQKALNQNRDVKGRGKLIMKGTYKKYLYVPALNAKNAIKKLRKKGFI